MIEVRGLTKTYGSFRAVDDVSFTVPEACVCGFLGPNGAGKSTTMKILAGYLAADEGACTVAGIRVDPDRPASRVSVGYLPENTPVDRRMRVAEYLDFVGRMRGMSASVRRAAIDRVVETTSLTDRRRQKIGTLSKGYRQRVGLAQALLADPPVLILDEPTSGLDPKEITRIRELVGELGKTKTVLLSTHVLSEVQDTSSRVVILRAGRVVAEGSPVELASQETAVVRVVLIEPPADAQAIFDDLSGVMRVEREFADDRRVAFRLDVLNREHGAREVLAAARTNGYDVYSLEQVTATLEDLFLSRVEEAGE